MSFESDYLALKKYVSQQLFKHKANKEVDEILSESYIIFIESGVSAYNFEEFKNIIHFYILKSCGESKTVSLDYKIKKEVSSFEDYKTCITCKTPLPKDMFYTYKGNEKRKPYESTQCSTCQCKAARQWKLNHPNWKPNYDKIKDKTNKRRNQDNANLCEYRLKEKIIASLKYKGMTLQESNDYLNNHHELIEEKRKHTIEIRKKRYEKRLKKLNG